MNDTGDGERTLEHTNQPTTRRPVVLMVEDTETDLDLYGGLLWYNGYDVVHAGDGPTAVTRAMETRPDLIFLDIMLPGRMDGLDVARVLRDQGIESPIVALSARSRDELGDRVDEAGVDAYLEKPIDPFAVVKETIRRIGLARPSFPD